MLRSVPFAVLQHLLSAFHLPRVLGRDLSHSLINKDAAEGPSSFILPPWKRCSSGKQSDLFANAMPNAIPSKSIENTIAFHREVLSLSPKYTTRCPI